MCVCVCVCVAFVRLLSIVRAPRASEWMVTGKVRPPPAFPPVRARAIVTCVAFTATVCVGGMHAAARFTCACTCAWTGEPLGVGKDATPLGFWLPPLPFPPPLLVATPHRRHPARPSVVGSQPWRRQRRAAAPHLPGCRLAASWLLRAPLRRHCTPLKPSPRLPTSPACRSCSALLEPSWPRTPRRRGLLRVVPSLRRRPWPTRPPYPRRTRGGFQRRGHVPLALV